MGHMADSLFLVLGLLTTTTTTKEVRTKGIWKTIIRLRDQKLLKKKVTATPPPKINLHILSWNVLYDFFFKENRFILSIMFYLL